MVVRVEDEWDESIVEVVDHLRPHLRHSSGHTGPVAQPVNTRPIKILREKITFLVAVAALGGGPGFPATKENCDIKFHSIDGKIRH